MSDSHGRLQPAIRAGNYAAEVIFRRNRAPESDLPFCPAFHSRRSLDAGH